MTKPQMQHLLDITDLDKQSLSYLLDKAQSFIDADQHTSSKLNTLSGYTVANVFFEPSTRTRCSFELAAKRLGAEVLNLEVERSSTIKGESLLDTIQSLQAMHINCFVIRHSDDNAIHSIAKNIKGPVSIINAGSGRYAHPSQALLD